MKFILLTILSTIIIFFVWNILKRLFFNNFYNYSSPQTKKTETQNTKEPKIKWDAQTVDYEEIKEKSNESK